MFSSDPFTAAVFGFVTTAFPLTLVVEELFIGLLVSTGFPPFETPVTLSLADSKARGDFTCSLTTLGLKDEPPLSELLVVDVEFLFLPSLGDTARVVGICTGQEYHDES